MMERIIYIITTDKYPEGDAGAIRAHSFAKIFQGLGYQPIVIGLGISTSFNKMKYDGIEYYSLRYSSNNILGKCASRLFFKKNAIKILRKNGFKRIRGAVYISGGKGILDYLKLLNQKKNIPLYYDSVEWYSPTEFKNGERSLSYQFNDKLNNKYVDESFKVFAISTYLEKHFMMRNINVLRIPVIMDVANIKSHKNTIGEYIKIIYAGQMGKKDQISYFISALSKLTQEELRLIRMYIIGMDIETYEKQFGRIPEELKNKYIFFTGRITRTEVLKHLSEANFTMLLRSPEERYAQAGFPTKVVESLASATPIICNYTSDLKDYLTDGYNVVIVRDCSIEACVEALRKAISISKEKQEEMRKNARKTAERYFDYRNYIDAVSGFIS